MLGALDNWLFDSSGLTAHGFCLLWEPGLIWTYAISDSAIALAYFSIPAMLGVVARRRKDLVFRPLLFMFAAFIMLCGTTHWLELATLWAPAYGLEAVVKVATAIVSVVTAFALWRLLPQALTFPSPAQLREKSEALRLSEERLHQAQKIETVGQLTGGIAHDFNNIVQVFTSGLTLLERRIQQGRLDEALGYIPGMRQSAESASALTNRLLAFARRQALQPRLIEPVRLLQSMEDMLRRTLGPLIQLEIQSEEQPWKIFCDPNQLESSLLNLAVNARDAMPDGGKLTIVTTHLTVVSDHASEQDALKPGDYVEFSVADTGEGMSADILGRVFEPFFTTKPLGKGTGLGLSQVYGFAKQSGGFVRIDSRPGDGTSVRVFLPAADRIGAIPSSTNEDLGAAETKFPPANGRVLIVEDQEHVRSQIKEALVEIGCAVIEARDGSAGLRVLESGAPFDLLVTDVGLPGLNGRQLADAARAIKPDLPVLLITGFAGSALGDGSLPSGMEIMRKPFALEEMTARVRALLTPGLSPHFSTNTGSQGTQVSAPT